MEDGVFHKERELEEQDIDTCLLVGHDHIPSLKEIDWAESKSFKLIFCRRFTNWILGRDINRF